MKAAIYCRVSTSSQEEGTSLESQLERCIEYAKVNGHEVRGEHIFLEQYSGADLILRPLLNNVRELVNDGIIETVIVYSTDRLSRDQMDLPSLVRELNACFVSGQSANAQTPEDILMLNVHGYTAATERRAIRERTMRGKRQTAKNGKMPNNADLYGYKPRYEFNAAGKPEITGREVVEEEATVVLRIFQEFADGTPKNAIATRLNQEGIPSKRNSNWHPWTLTNLLRNKAYFGVTVWGTKSYTKVKDQHGKKVSTTDPSEWVYLPGYTPPIITQELFDRVQVRLANSPKQGRPSVPYLFTGRVKCGYCGTGAVGNSQGKGRYRYYVCRGTIPTSARPAICSAHRIREDRLEPIIMGHIAKLVADPVTVLKSMAQMTGEEHGNQLEQDINHLRREIKNLANQEQRYLKAYALGEVDEEWIKVQSGPVKSRREATEEELIKLQKQRDSIHTLDDMRESLEDACAQIKSRFESLNYNEKKLGIDALDITATLTDDRVEVNAVLGVEEDDPRLATIARTSA